MNIPDTTDHQKPFNFPLHPMCVSVLPVENGTHGTGVEMNTKRQIGLNIPNIIDCN